MTPASIMMGVSRIETSWAPPPAIVGESGAEEKAKFFFPSIDDSPSEKKKKECPRVSRGKERRTKQKQKQASKQEKKTPLSLSFSLLTVEKKKAGEASRKKTPRSVSPSILFESLPEPFNKNALRPPVPRSLRGGSRVHGTAVGSDCGLRLCPCPQPLLSLLPLKKKHSRLHPAP